MVESKSERDRNRDMMLVAMAVLVEDIATIIMPNEPGMALNLRMPMHLGTLKSHREHFQETTNGK